jgi:hypothetical protein
MKKCSKCKETKLYIDFPRDRRSKDGYTSSCKSCRYKKSNEWARKNYKDNKKEVLEKNKAWRSENWDSVSKQRKESGYNIRSQKKWYHNKAKYDIQHVLKERLRKRIRNVVSKGYKSSATLELLGCTIEQLRLHLESQFQEGMNWANYGEWHIDHIQPCCSFDLSIEENQKKCFHYSNLQPLWAKDNLKKSKKDKLLSIKCNG